MLCLMQNLQMNPINNTTLFETTESDLKNGLNGHYEIRLSKKRDTDDVDVLLASWVHYEGRDAPDCAYKLWSSINKEVNPYRRIAVIAYLDEDGIKTSCGSNLFSIIHSK